MSKKDYFNQPLQIGDYGVTIVSNRTSSWFKLAQIVGETPQYLKIITLPTYTPDQQPTNKSPHLFLKYREEDVLAALMRMKK